MNAVQIALGQMGTKLIPFLQTAFDTEFTPTPISGTNDTYPHQKIWRSTLGLVLYPGAVLKELRAGAVAQQDFSESDLHSDFGVSAAYRFEYPLFERLVFTSDFDVRYLAKDSDDRASDLALVGSWVNKLVAPITKNLSVFLLADVAFFTGKTNAQPYPAASYILGGGVDFSAYVRL